MRSNSILVGNLIGDLLEELNLRNFHGIYRFLPVLTDDEKTRIQSLKKQLEMLKKQRERITKELTMLQRISKSGLKIRYNFVKPPFPTPGSPDFPTDNIIDLGEFQLQMESASE